MTDERDIAAMAMDEYQDRLLLRKAQMPSHSDNVHIPISAYLPPKPKPAPKQVQSVTITFERMPGLAGTQIYPIRFEFRKYPVHILEPSGERFGSFVTSLIITARGFFAAGGLTLKNKSDDDQWDIAMRMSAKSTVKNKELKLLYRAFRRWMWLKKAAHHCEARETCTGCVAEFSKTLHCLTAAEDIAREFGRVTVRVT